MKEELMEWFAKEPRDLQGIYEHIVNVVGPSVGRDFDKVLELQAELDLIHKELFDAASTKEEKQVHWGHAHYTLQAVRLYKEDLDGTARWFLTEEAARNAMNKK